MSATVAIIVLIALLINALGIVAFYYALWKGLLKPLGQQWREQDRATRRRGIARVMWMILFEAVLIALFIVSPFGHLTVAFVMGGFGVILMVGLPVLVWRSTHGRQ